MRLLLSAFVVSGVASTTSMTLPDFTWDTIPRFVHCGPTLKKFPTLEERQGLYKQLATFPLVTLEKFTWLDEAPVSLHEEAKILTAAAAIRNEGTGSKIIFYHMAWQDFSQFDLYNLTHSHVADGWAVSWDNGTIPGYNAKGAMTYNHSHPDMRAAWVASLKKAVDSGNVDGFFIDITPQALPNVTDPTDPDDGTVPYSQNSAEICKFCSSERQAALLDGLKLVLEELAAACPDAIIICNPADYGACNTQFFEYFGSSADHGRSVVGDFHILQHKYEREGHLVQARAATSNESTSFHVGEFLIGAGNYTYFGASTGWGCQDGWLEDGIPGDKDFWKHPLGVPQGPFQSKPNGEIPFVPKPGKPNSTTPGMVYKREFGVGTKVWLNLTDGSLWQHARACTRPAHVWPAMPTCPQLCIWWSDNAVTSFPPGFKCNKTALFDYGW